MSRTFFSWLAAIVLLTPLAGPLSAQVSLRSPQAGGGLTGASVGSASTLPASAPNNPAPSAVEPKGLTGMLAAQNETRAGLGLPALSWSAELAARAGATVTAASSGACSPTSVARVGKAQNATTYWVGGLRRLGGEASVQDISPAFLISEWRAGRNDYNLATATCQGKSDACERYARMVAPKAKAVGCARTTCNSQAQVWVCHYSE